ncbi:hypothetical protein ACIQ7Q_12955 [Streptomyces sp. NPDC096176]|uniref:hypothetical protein n=1 Tax=Streptomyces sp. NPDC096176 TaxID=3366079 RepID=UPI0037F396C1
MGTIHTNRRRTGIFAGTALLGACLLPALTACGTQAAGSPPPPRSAHVSLQLGGASLGTALATQATAQHTAAEKAAQQAAAEKVATDENVCTTDPADRPNCRNPSGVIDPNGGDIDGDGVFEDHEPVGPGYRDPRAYDGGKTSGETQCEWLRSKGIPC